MRLTLRHPWLWLGIGWLLIVSVIIASLVPGQKLPSVHVGDKYQHAAGYLLLTIWFAGVYPRSSHWKVGLGMLGLGIAIELAQGAMPFGRQADIVDIGANSLGIVIGLTLALAGVDGWTQKVESWIARD